MKVLKERLKQLGFSAWKRKALAYFELMIWHLRGKQGSVPYLAKLQTIRHYAKRFNLETFIETGTYFGDTVAAVKNMFFKIYSIELAPAYYTRAVERFKRDPNITILKGDSGVVLPELLVKIDSPALFWLDGHFSGGDTARGSDDSPIRTELKSILQWRYMGSVVLIDDAPLFTGAGGYPTIEGLRMTVATTDPRLSVEVDRGMIAIYSK